MSLDPFIGVWIGLTGSVFGLLAVGWFIGLFDRADKDSHDIPAE